MPEQDFELYLSLLSYTIRDGLIMVTTADEANQIQVYNVHDLLRYAATNRRTAPAMGGGMMGGMGGGMMGGGGMGMMDVGTTNSWS